MKTGFTLDALHDIGFHAGAPIRTINGTAIDKVDRMEIWALDLGLRCRLSLFEPQRATL